MKQEPEEWDRKERRVSMNQDQIDRDRLLSEVHANTKHIVTWAEKHDADDTGRFEKMDDRIRWTEKVLYGALGIFLFIEFITKVFPHS
jgi:hypothetical protein